MASMILITALSAVILASTFTSASSEVISTSIKVLEACSITSPTSDNTPYEIIGGTYESNIKETTINISCNDPNGYSLYAMGVDSTGTVSNTNLTGTVSGETIPTGTSTSTTVSNWAFKLSGVSGTYQPNILSDANGSFADYHIIPETNTKVANYTNAINNSTYSTVKATYAVAVTPYQRADTYVGRVKYTLVHPNYANDNGKNIITIATTNNATGFTIDGTAYTNGDTLELIPDGTTHTIVASTSDFNEGYEFDSWSATGGIILASTSSSTTTFTLAGNGTLTLNGKQSCQSSLSGSMQDFDPSGLCDGVTSGTLTDSRGGVTKSYTVTKLNDGKWWMTSNLNLPGGTTLNAADSDVPTASYYTLPASSTSGFSNDSGEYMYNSNNETTTCNGSTPCNSYYSWLVATAGGKDSSGNAVSTNGYNAVYSICPKGWRLPTSTTSNAVADSNNNWKTGDWYILATAYGADLSSQSYQISGTFYSNAGPGTTPNFLFAGDYYSGSFVNGGLDGRYWSSTSFSSTIAYFLYFYSGYVNSAKYDYRRYGFPVRCLFAE
ncbi:hypothetical protein IJG90_02145 [Candidatus Saccharibacteria bacterium]|nr:hypothetical protein [Candidatus Saccharibacteria bacterium]